MRLGHRQLEMLRMVGTTFAIIVPNRTAKRLVELGLMATEPSGGFARITPAGLRALADAADAGRIQIPFKIKKEDAPSWQTMTTYTT